MFETVKAPFAPDVKRVLSLIGCNKRTAFMMKATDLTPRALYSYWDDGSKDRFALIRNGQLVHVPVNGHPHYEFKGDPVLYEPQAGDKLVTYGVSRGKPATPYIVEY